MNTTDRILAAREGMAVERVHTAPHLKEYTVGQHVANIVMLAVILHPNPHAALLRAIVTHDIGERWSGDIPGYIKRVDPAIRAACDAAEEDHARRCGFLTVLNADDQQWLKALDSFELWLWCQDQLAFGNRHVEAIEEDVRLTLETEPGIPEAVRAAYREFARKGWRRLRHADLPAAPEPTVIPPAAFNAECPVCRDAGKKAHVGPCMTLSDEIKLTRVPVVEQQPIRHTADVTACGCRMCQHEREETARRNSTAADPVRIATILAGYGDPGVKA